VGIERKKDRQECLSYSKEENEMIEALRHKTVIVGSPKAISDNAAVTTATLDAVGAGWVTFLVVIGALDIAVAVLKLTESDDSGMSGAADVPGADFSVLPATLPAATADDTIVAIHVNMLGRKRYLDLTYTTGDGSAGTYSTVLAQLFDLQQTPDSATARGFTQELFAG
jgi:hypothetical protein